MGEGGAQRPMMLQRSMQWMPVFRKNDAITGRYSIWPNSEIGLDTVVREHHLGVAGNGVIGKGFK
jgi:hypothetical protein